MDVQMSNLSGFIGPWACYIIRNFNVIIKPSDYDIKDSTAMQKAR